MASQVTLDDCTRGDVFADTLTKEGKRVKHGLTFHNSLIWREWGVVSCVTPAIKAKGFVIVYRPQGLILGSLFETAETALQAASAIDGLRNNWEELDADDWQRLGQRIGGICKALEALPIQIGQAVFDGVVESKQ